jgi:hypothetical protein
MRSLAAVILLPVCAWAQPAANNPQLTSSKAFYQQIKTLVLKSADKLPEDKYSFTPAKEVRTYGQLLAHIADAQYVLCGTVKEGKPQFRMRRMPG